MASTCPENVKRVLVTGASGYLGAHVVQQLQKAGYRVRGTVRSLTNEVKIKPLKELCPGAVHDLELVEADLLKEDGWPSAMKDCSHVIHVASPFPNASPANEEEIIRPAVDGTLVVLKAAVAAKIKRVVLTSSTLAIGGFDQTSSLSESDWNSLEIGPAYSRSKTLAEKAAWDYVKELKDEDKIELAVINPSFILGPYLTNVKGTSASVISRILDRQIPMIPALNYPCIDVRDVAAAHITAMIEDEAVGHRHILVEKNLWLQEISVILAAEFKSQGYNPPTKVPPKFLLKIFSLFDSSLKGVLSDVGHVVTFDTTRMRDVLKISPIPIEETLVDMGYSLIERGWVKKNAKYTGRSQDVDTPVKTIDSTKEDGRSDNDKPADCSGDAPSHVEDVAENGSAKETKPTESVAAEETKPKESDAVEVTKPKESDAVGGTKPTESVAAEETKPTESVAAEVTKHEESVAAEETKHE